MTYLLIEVGIFCILKGTTNLFINVIFITCIIYYNN